MNKEKQIEEIAKTILDVDRSYYGMECDEIQAKAEATAIYDKGYRKIRDNDAIQCICYALGCQVAEKIKTEVAREIFAEIEKLKHTKWDWTDVVDWDAIAELKKKYTEGGE